MKWCNKITKIVCGKKKKSKENSITICNELRGKAKKREEKKPGHLMSVCLPWRTDFLYTKNKNRH